MEQNTFAIFKHVTELVQEVQGSRKLSTYQYGKFRLGMKKVMSKKKKKKKTPPSDGYWSTRVVEDRSLCRYEL